MGLGMMNRGIPTGVGGVSGTALPAATVRRTSGVTSYPVTVDFDRPLAWMDGDKALFRWSADPTFVTSVVEGPTVTLAAATTTNDFGLSTISGTKYLQMAAWRVSRPAILVWSNIVGVGDAVAPTITSSAAPSGYANIAGSMSLTANKAATWAIVGGADMAQFSIAGSTLSWLAQPATGNYVVQVQATSYFGVASAVQTITLAVAVNTADAFSFTDETGVARSTVKTSNTITVAGIGSGSIPVTVSGGTYSKNGGAYTSAAGTAANGDTFSVRQTSSASYSTSTDTTLTIGSTSDTYTVSTMADPSVVFSMTHTDDPPTQNIGFVLPTATFTGVALGPADATRKILVSVLQSSGGGATTAVTVGGISATQRGAANQNLSFWEATVPTGTTATIVVTAGANISYCGITVVSIIAASGPPTVHTPLAYGFNNSPQNISVTTPTGGGTYVVAEVSSLAGTTAFSNAVKQSQDSTVGETLSTALRATAGAATVSMTGHGNVNCCISALSYSP